MEDDIVITFPEWQVNLFDVDCTGNWAVLAVQKWLAIVSLNCMSGVELGSGEGREKAKRKLGTHNKYDIKALRWNPHFACQQQLACTNHQKLDIWDTHEGRQPFYSIKAHTRPLSDVCWSSVDPNLIATCAVESYVHIWDIRDSRRPKISFKTLGGLNSGASLVRWNRMNESIIASAHDSDIRIWDMKKPSTVTACISAHMNKIHDLDWSYRNERQLTSCSHDATIKFWDIQSPREPHSTIKAGTHPVWKSRNCPFGDGVAMTLVPAVHSGDSRVFLWSRTNLATPIHIFAGHSEAVSDIQWGKREKSCQLISLSKDHSLRVWTLREQLQMNLNIEIQSESIPSTEGSPEKKPLKVPVGDEAETSFTSELNTSIDGSSVVSIVTPPTPTLLSTPPSLFGSAYHSQTLGQEFNQVNLDIPNLEMERFDASQRSCTIKMEQGGHLLRVGITFPSHYPNGAAPSFILDASTTIDISHQQELISAVNDTAYANVRLNRPCLEQCLRKLAKSFETFLCRPEPPVDVHGLGSQTDFGKLDDEWIPFPRSSGARFCANGYIVCFSCSSVVPPDTKTPRSLESIHQYKNLMKTGKSQRQRSSTHLSSSLTKRTGSGNNLQSLSVGHSPLIKDKRRSGNSLSSMCISNTAVIFDISSLLPIDYSLAKSYSLIGRNIQELCIANASIAASFSRPDLVNTWTAVALIADSSIENSTDPKKGAPWAMHPFGRQLLQSLFAHYSKLHDVQTLAMLACLCQLQCLDIDEHFKKDNSSHSTTPPPTFTTTNPLAKKNQQANEAWENVLLELPEGANDEGHKEEMIQHHKNSRLLDETMSLRCDEYRRCYGDILYRWGLLTQRSEVMKYQSSLLHQQKDITLAGQCKGCRAKLEKPYCTRCQSFAITCALCNVAVKGCTNLCLNCGHGGHTHHLMEWFSTHVLCPSGCGCRCLEMSGWGTNS